MRISVVIPALNEEGVVGKTVRSVPVDKLRKLGLTPEIIVVDNGSQDNTAQEAEDAGARVIHEPRKGYGNAYLRGFREAKGDIIVMADADGTYPLETVHEFIKPILENGADFVMGSRLKGKINAGAMPPLHRYVGNPFLTFVLNLMFKAGISDAHCGMRALTRAALERMDLKTPGMEFASEMVIEAARKKLKIAELPIEYRPRAAGVKKLNSFHDGWRHLRFMLLYEPTAVFFIPGILIFIAGMALLLLSTTARVHSMILGSFLTILGLQIISLGLYSKIYAVLYRREVPDRITGFFLKYNSLEYGMLAGFMVFLIGGGVGFNIFMAWIASGYGELSQVSGAIFSVTFAILGIQTVFSAFFLSVLLLEKGE